MTPTTPIWPNFDIDNQAVKQAMKEIGDGRLCDILARAQQIKDEMKTGGSDWSRFLEPARPDEYDHDREAEEEA